MASSAPVLTVRPSAKPLILRVILSSTILIAAVLAFVIWQAPLAVVVVAGIIESLIVAIAVVNYSKTRFTKLTVEGDRLRYQEGMIATNSRNLILSKIQDVRVDQTLSGRILGVGTLSVETAGETSRLCMAGIDNPQQVADQILTLARQAK